MIAARNATHALHKKVTKVEFNNDSTADEFDDVIPIDPTRVRNRWQDKELWRDEVPAFRWLTFTDMSFELAYGEGSTYFDAFIISVIIVAGVMVGVQTYPEFECPVSLSRSDDDQFIAECKQRFGGVRDTSSVILGSGGVVDQCVTWIFVMEVVVKILANGLGPWMYFVGADWKWNCFDCFIVLMSFDEVAAMLVGGGGGSAIGVLRLCRLARLVKLVGKVPKLKSIVTGLIAGLMACSYIAVLLFLVFYIFAVAGITFFGANDPLHFRTVPIALLTLFRACTLEDWTDVMYINIFGCDRFSSGLYYPEKKFWDAKTKQDIPGAFEGDPFYSSWKDVPAHFRCREPEAMPVASVVYWVLFVIISAFVMVSLFVGAVCLAMSQSMDESKRKQQEVLKKKAAFEEAKQAREAAARVQKKKDLEAGHRPTSFSSFSPLILEPSSSTTWLRRLIFALGLAKPPLQKAGRNGGAGGSGPERGSGGDGEDGDEEAGAVKPDLVMRALILDALALAGRTPEPRAELLLSPRKQQSQQQQEGEGGGAGTPRFMRRRSSGASDTSTRREEEEAGGGGGGGGGDPTATVEASDQGGGTHGNKPTDGEGHKSNGGDGGDGDEVPVRRVSRRFSHAVSPKRRKSFERARTASLSSSIDFGRSEGGGSCSIGDGGGGGGEEKVEEQVVEFVDGNRYALGAWSRCALMCKDTAEAKWFANFVTLCIVGAGVTVGVNSEFEHADVDPHARRRGEASASVGQFLWFANTGINWVFTVEVALKIVGEDWHPWTFFHSHWNKFDFCIVAASWLPFFLDAGGVNALKLLRLLRLFRILRLIKFLPQLAVIVDSLIEGLESIGFIAVIMATAFYMFAILGMLLFQHNDPFHFGYLHRAMFTLFRMCTFDDWTDVMYINVYGCDRWGYADDDSKPHHALCSEGYLVADLDLDWLAALYFITFIIIGAWVLVSLFIGVVTTSMEEAQARHEAKMKAFARMLGHAASHGVVNPKQCCKSFLAAFERIDVDQSGLASVEELAAGLLAVGFQATMEDIQFYLRHQNEEESKSPEGEADPYEFYLFLLYMCDRHNNGGGDPLLEAAASSSPAPGAAPAAAEGQPMRSDEEVKSGSDAGAGDNGERRRRDGGAGHRFVSLVAVFNGDPSQVGTKQANEGEERRRSREEEGEVEEGRIDDGDEEEEDEEEQRSAVRETAVTKVEGKPRGMGTRKSEARNPAGAAPTTPSLSELERVRSELAESTAILRDQVTREATPPLKPAGSHTDERTDVGGVSGGDGGDDDDADDAEVDRVAVISVVVEEQDDDEEDGNNSGRGANHRGGHHHRSRGSLDRPLNRSSSNGSSSSSSGKAVTPEKGSRPQALARRQSRSRNPPVRGHSSSSSGATAEAAGAGAAAAPASRTSPSRPSPRSPASKEPSGPRRASEKTPPRPRAPGGGPQVRSGSAPHKRLSKF